MNKCFRAVALTTTLALAAGHAQPAAAGVCHDLGGSIVFRDMLYGLGTGVVLTGLTLLVVKEQEQQGRKLAAGTLVGASVGTAFGFVETAWRPGCNDGRSEDRDRKDEGRNVPNSVHWRPLVTAGSTPGLGLTAAVSF
jgi:hypothetical protein